MAYLNGFDANQVEPRRDFEPIPAGKYVAVISESEFKPTKAGDGRYLALTFQVLEGPFANRRLWARLNLNNPNPKAVGMAQADLSAICRAVGVLRPKESCELHDLPLVLSVKCQKRKDTGEIVNEISGYAAVQTPPPPLTPVTESTISAASPWSRA